MTFKVVEKTKQIQKLPGPHSIYCPVGGFNPFEKYARQIGSFPQVAVNVQEYLKPPLSCIFTYMFG